VIRTAREKESYELKLLLSNRVYLQQMQIVAHWIKIPKQIQVFAKVKEDAEEIFLGEIQFKNIREKKLEMSERKTLRFSFPVLYLRFIVEKGD
jgi:hypothetical protein